MTTIAISHTWPDIKNAEYEVLQRLLAAAEMINAAVIVIDRHGSILWHSDGVPAIIGETLKRGQASFLISLHFESPKVVDIYSYYALWQPTEFYATFGYDRTIKSMLSHDDLLSCDSDIADAHGMNLFDAINRRVVNPLPRMYHTLPQPFLEPAIDASSRIFYVGVNWERLGKTKGRFHDALLTLAKKDLVDIYGPEQLLGVAPWEGFATYQGELPFDGEAIKFALNRAGVCLALSSKAHVETGIMSNRLFEGFAGGAAVICNNNPFIAKHFADEVYIVDSERGEEALANQVIQVLRRIRANPSEAIAKVLRAQSIMRAKFALENNLQALIYTHEARANFSRSNNLLDASVTLIADFRGSHLANLDRFLESLRTQVRAKVDLHLLCDASVVPFVTNRVQTGGSLRSARVLSFASAATPTKFDGIQPLKVRRGGTVADIIGEIETTYFAFANPSELFFNDHFAKLAAAIQGTEGALAAVGSSIVASVALNVSTSRTLEETIDGQGALLNIDLPICDTGRFLFDRRLAKTTPEHLFLLLDRSEHLFYLAMAAVDGPVARTFQPSLERNLQFAATLPVADDTERQHIRDYLAFRPRWQRASAAARASTETDKRIHQSDAPKSHLIASSFPTLYPNRRYDIKQDGDGLGFLSAGFSKPEQEFVWCLERGIIDFSLPDITRLDSFTFVFRLALVGRHSSPTGRPQHITVAFNGAVIGYYPTTGSSQILSIALPISIFPAGNRFRLELIPDHTDPVRSPSGEVLDSRLLSFRLSSLILEQSTYISTAAVSVDEVIEFKKTGMARDILTQNFHIPEENWTWVAGRHARMQFYFDSDLNRGVVRLGVVSRASLETGALQGVSLTLNGINLGEVRLQTGLTSCSFDFEISLMKGDLVDLNIYLSHAEAVFNDLHEILDSRLLGLALVSMSIGKKTEEIEVEP